MRIRLGSILGLAVLAAAASACSSLGDAVGSNKNPPDEFAISTRAPLVVPPEYGLRPPRPGETRPQEQSAAERARALLVGDVSSAPPSQGEQLLVRRSGALSADPSIRAILAAENGGRGEKEASLANALIFWRVNGDEIDYGEAPLRVNDPAEWLADRQESIETVLGEDAEVEIKRDRTLLLPGIL